MPRRTAAPDHDPGYELEETALELGDAEELADPEFQDATWNIYRLGADGTPPPGTRIGSFICKVRGPLDLEALREKIGGGTFRAIGTLPGKRRRWTTFALDGPARELEAAPAPAPPAPAPAPAPLAGYPPIFAPDPITALREELRELRRELEPRKASADPIAMLAAVIQLVRDNAPPPPPAPTEAVIGPILSMLDKGIKLGRSIEGSGESLGDILRAAVPALLSSFKPAPAPAPSPLIPKPTSPPTGTPARDGPDELAALLADAVQHNRPIGDTLRRVELKLTGSDLEKLAHANAEQVLFALGPARRALHPALESPQARDYLEQLLAALRGPDDDEDEDDDGDREIELAGG